jgi:endoglucanase
MPAAVPRRRALLAGAAAALAWLLPRRAPAAAGGARPECAADWPGWEGFVRQFLREGDRVVDPSSPVAHTVSEGQAYALFFCLVAGDRARFERILRWTEDNLAGGDLSLRLPAWQWGRQADGSYGILDANSASDADLWLAYVLGEAGRLWRERRYQALSTLLARRILSEETARLPGLGLALLPGPHGFAEDGRRWRLNPCYAPLFITRWLAEYGGDRRWADVLQANLRLLRESAPRGLAPDWAWYEAPAQDAARASRAPPPGAAGFDRSPQEAADRIGSFDAIRVYLWLGITSATDPARAALLEHFAPMADLVEQAGTAPRAVEVFEARSEGAGPAGFAAALLPFLAGLGREQAAQALWARLQRQPAAADAYFEQALSLFGLGWREGRYAVAADGSLLPAWQRCAR